MMFQLNCRRTNSAYRFSFIFCMVYGIWAQKLPPLLEDFYAMIIVLLSDYAAILVSAVSISSRCLW